MFTRTLARLHDRPADPRGHHAPDGHGAAVWGSEADGPPLRAEDWLRLFWHVGVGTMIQPLSRLLGMGEAPLRLLLDEPEMHDMLEAVELLPSEDDTRDDPRDDPRDDRSWPYGPDLTDPRPLGPEHRAEARLDLRDRLRAHARAVIHRTTTGAGRNLRVLVWCRWVRLVHRADPLEHLLDDLLAALDRPRRTGRPARRPANTAAHTSAPGTPAAASSADIPAASRIAIPTDGTVDWSIDWFEVGASHVSARAGKDGAATTPAAGAATGPRGEPAAATTATPPEAGPSTGSGEPSSDPANDPRLLRRRLARFASGVSRDLRRRLIEDFFDRRIWPSDLLRLGIDIRDEDLEPPPRRKPAERWNQTLDDLAATMPVEPEPPPQPPPGRTDSRAAPAGDEHREAPPPTRPPESPCAPAPGPAPAPGASRPELHPRTRPPD